MIMMVPWMFGGGWMMLLKKKEFYLPYSTVGGRGFEPLTFSV
jgi:hypothetical protein